MCFLADSHDVSDVDLPGLLRRIRRLADSSQRELAARLGISKSAVAAAECGSSGLDIRIVARAAALAGLRLALLDSDACEVGGMVDAAVRDMGGRRFPAHLDTRYGDVDWWHDDGRYSREQPWYTFDRVRYTRDYWRERLGTPEDHQLPQPGDSPAERKAARRRAAREDWEAEIRRRRAAGELPEPEPFSCSCPPACDELEDWSGRPVHADRCPCGCDLG
jgi:transcriptional regulator with XRE-family HTH domain